MNQQRLAAMPQDKEADTPAELSNNSNPEDGLPPPDTSRRPRWTLYDVVDVQLAYIPLLICCFVSGLTDSTLYNAYGTFVSMQTGNTIFLSLGASGQNNKPFGWARSLISIACFILGSFAFSRAHARLNPRRRSTLFLSFLVQALLVALASALIQGGVIDGAYPSTLPAGAMDWKQLAPTALLSFQAAGQIVNSRNLGVGEVPTVVITSLLCDLMSDPALFLCPPAANTKRNKRAVAFVLTLVGGVCGGWIAKATGMVQPALWIVAGIKLMIAVGWLAWPHHRDGDHGTGR